MSDRVESKLPNLYGWNYAAIMRDKKLGVVRDQQEYWVPQSELSRRDSRDSRDSRESEASP